ncbi:REF/SRPP-like protein At1g67360 [Cornus florida]|uniref:REF/SRPP-like protein At1g67360 n=1 Tax=Cornus florida TaxID=4283 RepID=UPI00289E16C6|nr:REF/SRPP-like protein At1g67360 [Cornus florida]
MEMENKGRELKHLGFVRMIAIHAVVCVSNLYEYAKGNSGPLKSTVGTVENIVATVVSPVYEKFKSTPGDVLVFLDEKVDEGTMKFDEHAPPLAKQVVSQAQCVARKTSEVAQVLVHEALVGGPYAAIHYAGTLYKELLVNGSVRVWYGVNQIPPFHAVAEMVVPTAGRWSEKYNKTIADMTAKGHTLFSYFPLVPIDEMTKAYKQVETAKKGDATACAEPQTEMN